MSLQDSERIRLILNGSIPSMLFKLATPNMISVIFMLVITYSEIFFAGQLGIIPLAAVAVVFPLVSLAGMIGQGAIGGGVVSALSRSIGSNDINRANFVVWHSIIVYSIISILFFVIFVGFSKHIFSLIGVEEEVVNEALTYSRIFFGFSPFIFLFFLLTSIFRAFGDYQYLARINIITGLAQLLLAGSLSLGWWFFPSLGLVGLALAMIIPQAIASIYMLISIYRGRYNISIKITSLRKDIFIDIFKVGGVGAINSISIALTILITTAFIANFGTEAVAGYGVCARLEQTLIPFAFGVGGVLTSTTGVNFGAKQFARARKSAWFGAGIIASIVAIVGITLSILPSIWLNLFTDDPNAYAIGALYLSIVGPFYMLFAFGKTLYFASQGTGNMFFPIVGGISRLLVVSIFGILIIILDINIKYLFFTIGIAMSLVGLVLFLNMFGPNWNPETKNVSLRK